MLDLRRLRLLHELHARGTIAEVASALQFTPSAVSQQLAVLEREAGVTLLVPKGRGVALTDAAVVLARHAAVLLERAEFAEAELAAAAGHPAGRARIASFQSVGIEIAVPAMQRLERDAPGLRCELIEAEPEQSLPALALGDFDLVLADEWQHQPRSRPPAVDRQDLHRDMVRLALPERHPVALRHPHTVSLTELRDSAWTTGQPDTGWEEMTLRTCRERGGFDPDIRHRTNDSVTTLAIVAAGQGVTLLPELVGLDERAGIAVREIAGGPAFRTIFTAVRSVDLARPTVRALLAAVRAAAGDVGMAGS